MSERRYDYWTHGVATILEYPERAKLVRHSGYGTSVEQEAKTKGWFHIPIPTPSVLEGDTTIGIKTFALVAKVNENAKVDRLHLRRGKDLIFDKEVSFIGTAINQAFSDFLATTSTGSTGNAVTLCVHVEFLTGSPRGRVEFYGAGACFVG